MGNKENEGFIFFSITYYIKLFVFWDKKNNIEKGQSFGVQKPWLLTTGSLGLPSCRHQQKRCFSMIIAGSWRTQRSIFFWILIYLKLFAVWFTSWFQVLIWKKTIFVPHTWQETTDNFPPSWFTCLQSAMNVTLTPIPKVLGRKRKIDRCCRWGFWIRQKHVYFKVSLWRNTSGSFNLYRFLLQYSNIQEDSFFM